MDEIVKKTLKIYPYVPGGEGSSIASYLAGRGTPRGVEQAGQPHVRRGHGKVMNTIPPSDFSYCEMLNEAVQMQPADVMDPEIAGQIGRDRHRERQALQSRCPDEKDPRPRLSRWRMPPVGPCRSAAVIQRGLVTTAPTRNGSMDCGSAVMSS